MSDEKKARTNPPDQTEPIQPSEWDHEPRSESSGVKVKRESLSEIDKDIKPIYEYSEDD